MLECVGVRAPTRVGPRGGDSCKWHPRTDRYAWNPEKTQASENLKGKVKGRRGSENSLLLTFADFG